MKQLEVGGNDSGWKAEWHPLLDPYVDIVVDAVNQDEVTIQKAAEFIQGPNGSGLFPPIAITFTQTSPDAVSRITINDEIIKNSTGVDWTDFHMQLVDSGDAQFNKPDSDASAGGSGFSIFPFTQKAFGPGLVAPFTTFDVWGGTVPDGSTWFPGDGPFDGELFIDLVVGSGTVLDPFTTFTLKEWPTAETVIPEPASWLLVCIGLFLLAPLNRRK